MSRIGRMPIPVPAGVTIELTDGHARVVGPKGELARSIPSAITVEREDGHLLVKRPSDAREHRALHGVTRALIANIVTGVTTGFAKTLDLTGVGYRATRQVGKVVFQLGYTHPVEFTPPPRIQL